MNLPANIHLNSFNGSDIKIEAAMRVARQVSVAASNDETQLSKSMQEEILAWAKHAQASNGFG